MDISTTNTAITTTTTTTASVKTPEAETETPTRIQPTKLSSLSNGVLKRHPSLHRRSSSFNNHHHHHQHAASLVVTYKECLKNHAASLGGHAVDGCGEFMPSPAATPADPTSLKCAACGCHRNFHRREPEEPVRSLPNTTAALEYQPHHRHHPPPPALPVHRSGGGHSSPPSSPSPPPISSSYYPSAPHMLLALSTGFSAPPQDTNVPQTPTANPGTAVTAGNSNSHPNGRKRFRTKFTPDQKERMLDFAEKIGWKIQKRDEDLIAEFCSKLGVDKGVLKVWMHNNKNTLGKKDHHHQANISLNDNVTAAAEAEAEAEAEEARNHGNGNGMEFTIHYHHQQNHENENKNGSYDHDLLHNSDSVSAHVVATNGSSSSS